MNLILFLWLSGLFITRLLAYQMTQVRYSRSQLIDLCTSSVTRRLLSDVTAHVNTPSRRRGCRAGRKVKLKLQRRALGVHYSRSDDVVDADGDQYRPIPTIITDRPASSSRLTADRVDKSSPPQLVRVHRPRHSMPPTQQLVVGCMNVQSANSKIDDILAMKRDHSLDLLCLCETWHDTDSVSIRRLRAEGLQVLERARQRPTDIRPSLTTNHGGVALAASRGVKLTAINTGGRKSNLEHICARVSSRDSSCVVLLIYRPGSVAADSGFFDDLADLLDRLVTFVDPLMIVGDLNIRLDRADDPACRRLQELLATYDLNCCVSTPTHDCGGTLDVVVTRRDAPVTVQTIDPGFSDHRLLRWTCNLKKPAPVYEYVTRRPWRRLDVDVFKRELRRSRLCGDIVSSDANTMAELYDSEIKDILDRILPVKTSLLRRRPSDPWFDDECREAKRRCRQLERAASRSPLQAATWHAERRCYRRLISVKRRTFWSSLIADQRYKPREMWKSIDKLLGRGRSDVDTDINANDFVQFFDKKVEDIRSATANAPQPDYVATGCMFHAFRSVSADDVAEAVRKLPNKQCSTDPMPTWLLKECIDDLAPYLSQTFSLSLQSGVVPAAFKTAVICPRIKKPSLDPSDVKNYRPISNLTVMSKLLERIVARQLMAYLSDNDLLPDRQSAYRAFRSTETAIARLLSDILTALDAGDIAALALLDLSAAFDTVDHSILLHRLKTSFGLSGSVLAWFSSYIDQRRHYVSVHGEHSAVSETKFGVPQGSVLGPILFIMYTVDVISIVERAGLSVHQFADDTQIYGSCRSHQSASLCHDIGVCVDSVACWTRSNRLQLNADKTEFMWCVPPRRRHQLPDEPLPVSNLNVEPVSSVRDLGVYLDTDMSMNTHITQLVCTCFGILRQIRCIRRSLPRSSLATLITAFILSKVDYCNVVLSGLPNRDLERVQSVINAAARLTTGARKYDHVMPLLKDLHWLRVPERITYKLCVLVRNCLHGTAPRYLQDVIQPVAVTSRRRLRSTSSSALVVPITRRSTIGDRAFAVAGPRAWNSLPEFVIDCSSPGTFRKYLKTYLFSLSF